MFYTVMLLHWTVLLRLVDVLQ